VLQFLMAIGLIFAAAFFFFSLGSHTFLGGRKIGEPIIPAMAVTAITAIAILWKGLFAEWAGVVLWVVGIAALLGFMLWNSRPSR